jgi:hypothetical protein
MRRSQRLISAGVLFALCSVLAGCGGGGLSSFDPTDMLDFLDTKKKLPGNRQPVFPEGVPGLEQGVPKDLYKGSAEERAREEQLKQQQAAVAPEEPKVPPKPKAKAKHAVKPKAAAPAEQEATPADGEAPPAAEPAPKPAKRAKRTAPATPPAQPDPQAQPPAQPPQSAFPAPVPSGSFSR